MDAEVISIQLQGLLNIPPIQKQGIPGYNPNTQTFPVERRNNVEELNLMRSPPTSILKNTQPLNVGPFTEKRQQNGKVDGGKRKEIQDLTSSPHPSQSKTENPGRTHPLNRPIRPPPEPLPRNGLGLGVNVMGNNSNSYNQEQVQKQYNERTPPYQMTNPNVQGESSAEGRRGYLQSNESMRSRAKVISHMKELLKNSGCPRNMVTMGEKLIEAALEEHKPTYYLHLDKEVIQLFLIHGIEPLAKRSKKFVRAKYFCRLCNYHMDYVTNVISHASNSRHTANEQLRNLEQHVESIPFPTFNHEMNLHLFIAEVMKTVGIDETERELRYGVLRKLNEHLAPHKFELELFGSSVPGFGFKSSDINLNLDLTKVRSEETDEPLTNADHTIQVTKLSKLLETFSFVRDVGEGYHSLQIKFRDIQVDRFCSIQVNNVSGVLLSQLFQEYDKLDSRVRPLVVAFRNWARTTEIDDQEQGLLPGHVYTIMALKHLLDVRVIPYIIDPDSSVSFRSFYKPKDSLEKWVSPNRQNLGGLWLGLLRKYSIEFPVKEQVVSLVQAILLKSEDKIWSRKLSVEDPILPRSDLCRSASTSRVFDYIFERIKLGFKYFGLPRMMGRRDPIFERIIPLGLVRQGHRIYFYSKPGPVSPGSLIGTGDNVPQRQTESEGNNKGVSHEREEVADIPRIRLINMCDYNGEPEIYIIAEDLGLLDKMFTPGDFYYEFDKTICQGGEEPPNHCRSCGQDGHTKRNCPEEVVPPLAPVSVPDALTLKVLDNVMLNIYADKALTDQSASERKVLLDDIFHSLVHQFPDIELILFGSTVNGFGLRGSDVDVSVRFKNHPIRKAEFHTEEVTTILKGIVERLRTSGCMQEILAIPSAKVPIVKFKHKRTRLEGDLSLSNELALRNTKLLRSYADIDPRVKVLGCFLKQLTKLCDISDASKGSLSSYAYVLMLIHFLQQHSTPVLPVLQQIPADNRPEHLADGWETYFFESIQPSILCGHWRHFHSNKESVAQLLLGFIKYYTETFNFEEHVVTISQLEPLSRKEKRWTTGTLICIEDPFEKSHNLGAGLTRRMSVFIVKTLQRYREVFSRSIQNFSPNFNYTGMFMDPGIIRGDLNPPIDRQCRICNKIGHFANTCNFENGTVNEEPEGGMGREERNEGQESPPESPREDGLNLITPHLDIRMLPHSPAQIKQGTRIHEPENLQRNHGSENRILDNGIQFGLQNHVVRNQNTTENGGGQPLPGSPWKEVSNNSSELRRVSPQTYRNSSHVCPPPPGFPLATGIGTEINQFQPHLINFQRSDGPVKSGEPFKGHQLNPNQEFESNQNPSPFVGFPFCLTPNVPVPPWKGKDPAFIK